MKGVGAGGEGAGPEAFGCDRSAPRKSVPGMRRNRTESRDKNLARRVEQVRPTPPEFAAATAPPRSLHHVQEEVLGQLEPGDVVRLDQAPSLRYQVASAFCAVLACPRCGAPGLITYAQYFAAAPVICGASHCPCRFKIEDQSHLVYLPVN